MTDPRRLAEQDELSRLLIDSASEDLPGAEGRARARRAALAAAAVGVGVGASVGLVTSSAKAASEAAGWVALKWLVLVSAPIAVASVSYVALRDTEPQPSRVGSAVAPVSARPAERRAAELVPPPEAAPTVAAAPPAVPTPPSARPGAPPRASAAKSLQAEITELDRARHALARGDGSVLDRYLAEHPRGALREQALWMKISSLEQAGRHAEAKALAKRMLASYPNGSFSTRARALIER